MNNEMFQKIFDILQETMETDWFRIIFYAGYADNNYSMKYFVDAGEGRLRSCFEMPGFSMAEITKTFARMNNVISEERNKMGDQEKWTALTMIVDSTGEMKTFFDYTDLNENSIEYEKQWKKTYMK